ncbi:MAG: adenylyl-sulfate kinase [Bacteroidetes bacterium GWA2_30_7]|nr:MAG: adenylyl-sulfate kinase [Bacteroidetes bacterium GWA2_30_7]
MKDTLINNFKNLKSDFLRKSKSRLLNQKSIVVWLTGLSGSGKTTIAYELEKLLLSKHFISCVIDGDDVRSKLNSDLGFSENDRKENIRRVAEVAKMLVGSSIIAICSFVSPTESIRAVAENILADNFIEIYVNSPIEVCEKRDVKGLYKRARNGEIFNFTGIDSPYEAPKNPFLEVRSDLMSVKDSVNLIFQNIIPLIEIKV